MSSSPRSPATNRRVLTLALLVTSFLTGLDFAVVSTAMPTVIGQLGGIGLYAWVFSGYLLTSTVTVPLYGKLTDLYGRKPVYLVATGLFSVGSMLSGQAQTMEQLILFRFLQGVGAGGVYPVTLTILGDTFPLEQRARITGLFSVMWGVAALTGPSIGGFLTEQLSWRWVFYVNVPFCVLAMGLVWRFLHERVARQAHRIDYSGALLLTGAVVALLFALRNPAEGGIDLGPWAGPLLGLVSAALLGVFVWHEQRVAEPLLPLGLFRNRVIGVGTVVAFLTGVVMFAQSAFVPPFVQGVMGASPTTAGLVLSSTSIGWTSASWISGRAMLRWGYRVAAVGGGVFLTLGFVLLSLMRASDSAVYAAFVQAVIGLGFGALVPITTVSTQNAVAWEQRGVVTGLTHFARQIGGTVGVSVAGALFAGAVLAATGAGLNTNALLAPDARATLTPAELAAVQDALGGSLHVVFRVLAAVAAATVLAAAFLPGGHPDEHAWQASAQPPAEHLSEGNVPSKGVRPAAQSDASRRA